MTRPPDLHLRCRPTHMSVPFRRVTLAVALLLARPLPAQLLAPAPTGPHAVGRRTTTWIDSTRRDPTDGAGPRAITVWLWYPAARAGGAPPEPALPGTWGERRATASAEKIGAPAAEAMRTLRVHAVTGAPWSPSVARAPVVIFTPGNGWLPTDYAVLVEDLASHGYLVVGVAPAGLADVVVHADGRVVRKTLGVGPAIVEDQRHAHADVLHVLGRLAALDGASDSPFRGHVDRSRVAAIGHSLGGTTALVAAARDDRVRAAVNLDGDAMGEVLAVRPRQPLLLVSSEVPEIGEAPAGLDSTWYPAMAQGLARSERRRTGEWAELSAQASSARRLRIMGARHLDFTDAALAASLVTEPRLRWMRFGPAPGARTLRATADLVRAFLDDALRGRAAAATLDHPEQRYDGVQLVPPV